MRQLSLFASGLSFGNRSPLGRCRDLLQICLCIPSMSCIHGDTLHLLELFEVVRSSSQGLGRSIHMLDSIAISGTCQYGPRPHVLAWCRIFGPFAVVRFGLVLLVLLGLGVLVAVLWHPEAAAP